MDAANPHQPEDHPHVRFRGMGSHMWQLLGTGQDVSTSPLVIKLGRCPHATHTTLLSRRRVYAQAITLGALAAVATIETYSRSRGFAPEDDEE